MPHLPPKPCSLPYCRMYATKYGRCDDHQPESGWFKQGSRHERGYGHEWDAQRDRILVRDEYLCQRCKRRGIYTEARDVDHIVPKSRGGKDDWDNLEAICPTCHKLKTQLERSFPRKAIRPHPPQYVFLVCGPPGAGKTTWCHTHKGTADVVIDLDDIMVEMSGLTRAETDTRHYYRQALSERNRRIDALHESNAIGAFIIMSLPKVTMRRDWAELLRAEIQLLVPDRYECEKRILWDETRGDSGKRRSLDALDRWFAQYSR